MGDIVSMPTGFYKHWLQYTTNVPVVVQDKEELMCVFHIIQGMGCTDMLEIGSSNGISTGILSHALRDYSKVVCVDLGEKHTIKNLEKVLQKIGVYKKRPYLYVGNSQIAEMATKVASDHPEGFDVVFIDADHSYTGVKTDYEYYKDLARKVIILHDINMEGPGRLFEEEKSKYKYLKITSADAKKGFGVFFK
jgi:predicted O-methyltransferase YrrM